MDREKPSAASTLGSADTAIVTNAEIISAGKEVLTRRHFVVKIISSTVQRLPQHHSPSEDYHFHLDLSFYSPTQPIP